MKNLFLTLFIAATIFGCKDKTEKSQKEMTAERVEEAEAENPPQEWTALFDGTSFDGWKEYQNDEVSDNWKIEDGALVLHPPKNRKEGEIHDLVTKKEFTNFILSLDWRISEGGNSGVMWGVQEDAKYKKPYNTGPEIQVLDNEKHPDAKVGPSHQSGALYDLKGPSKDVTKPVGEWNTMVITVDNDNKRGSVELNGEEVVAFPVGNEMWNVMVSKSKFADWEGFGKFIQGKIALQDHGNGVSYRNIKIKEL
ncbi:protein of unknown function [Pricia antarctica]|uniref:3-keto-alpha-glucoside-1,2-lyase/3-keto-2-hydroxy-glucal hydratase domain-containing protein n=1 Tax=Pricia antarctica TaxID=641691 RepID=A0A1G6XYG5_9FLAO|nr:DUF1080 domain-containing protein [Pricia antarctica]SDD83264.1 protein of unknown function [Pricia antarctica]